MANELVPIVRPQTAVPLTDEGEWDLPPIDDGAGRRVPHRASDLGTARRRSRDRGADVSDRDAENARAAGDGSYAVLRETDAAEQRQHGWGTGDARTWGWIFAMCAVFLLMVALVYYLPYGQHNQSDGGNSGGSPTPAIRPY